MMGAPSSDSRVGLAYGGEMVSKAARAEGLDLTPAHLSREDLDAVLSRSHEGFDDGAADVAGTSCDCDDGHG